MKKIVALTAALSFLTATAAFATTEVPAKAPEKMVEHKAPEHKMVKKAEHKKIEHKKMVKKAEMKKPPVRRAV